MKRLLIISPYFPPVNAADMHRVRMSLRYYESYGWQPEVVTVDPAFTDLSQDPLFSDTVPSSVTVHRIGAFNKKFTAKFGLGSLALRSLWHYRQYVDELLIKKQFDLVFFSTTQFPICILGPYWLKKHGIPYIIDMQDPWHSDYYKTVSRSERPPKFWFSYPLNKLLERPSITRAAGLISVSENYLTVLKQRYPIIADIPVATIPFGALPADIDIARSHAIDLQYIKIGGKRNIVYIGRGGADMEQPCRKLFEGFRLGLSRQPTLFGEVLFWFIGTSYAPTGIGIPTIKPLADGLGVGDYVYESTDRIGFYHALATLDKADVLFLPGSKAPGYSPSKIYPYILTGCPLLAIVPQDGPAFSKLVAFGCNVLSYEDATPENVLRDLLKLLRTPGAAQYNKSEVAEHTAEAMTRAQCQLFNEALSKYLNR